MSIVTILFLLLVLSVPMPFAGWGSSTRVSGVTPVAQARPGAFPPAIMRLQRGGDIFIGERTTFPRSEERLVAPRKIGTEEFSGHLTAMSAFVQDASSGAPLFMREQEVVRPIASITKLMTAIVFLESRPDFSRRMTLTIEDERAGHLYLSTGENVSLRDLYFTALVGSSNNATVALARSTGLTMVEFTARMNEKAAALGMTKTRFVEPTGLDGRNVSTARDTARLVEAALREPLIRQATTKADYLLTVGKERRVVKNTDMFLTRGVTFRLAAVNGGKTGYIEESGYNFAVEVEDKAGHAIRVVVLGAADPFARFTETQELAEWVFKNYEWPR